MIIRFKRLELFLQYLYVGKIKYNGNIKTFYELIELYNQYINDKSEYEVSIYGNGQFCEIISKFSFIDFKNFIEDKNF